MSLRASEAVCSVLIVQRLICPVHKKSLVLHDETDLEAAGNAQESHMHNDTIQRLICAENTMCTWEKQSHLGSDPDAELQLPHICC